MTATKNAALSAAILRELSAGKDIAAAVDAVLGSGTYAQLASDLYDALRTR